MNNKYDGLKGIYQQTVYQVKGDKTLLVIYRAQHRLLPGNVQKLFVLRSEDHNQKRKFNFKIQCAGITFVCLF